MLGGEIVILTLTICGLIVCIGVLRRAFNLTEVLRANTVKEQLSQSVNPGSNAKAIDELKQLEIQRIKKITSYAAETAGSARNSIASKFFRSGMYSPTIRRSFRVFQVISFLFGVIVLPSILYALTGIETIGYMGIVLGALIGLIFPNVWLDRKIQSREEDIRYFLPLLIEQISIGVSSALVVGSCIKQIIETADERDAHNPVTELLIHSDRLMKSGLSMEEALMEVAEVSGMNEVQHSFMFLVQCAKHGGEISKQLQDLADSTMSERTVQVQARISALPVKATGPLGLVFAGFFAMLLSGVFVRVGTAFSGSGIGGM